MYQLKRLTKIIVDAAVKATNSFQGPLLLTWFNFNPSMEK